MARGSHDHQPVIGLLICLLLHSGCCEQTPQFIGSLENVTVAVGKDASFQCQLQHLGNFRVGWVKADNKAIQAIHMHVITHNTRVRVTHPESSSWWLHISSVQLDDAGAYMCQVNSDPMISQYGYLNVVVPPDIDSEQSTSDLTLPENGSGQLVCRARGHPTPKVVWRREDGRDMSVLQSSTNGRHHRVSSQEGEVLMLYKVRRADSGVYLCIARNGLPPSVSKKVHLQVHFAPVVRAEHQLYGVAAGGHVTMSCHVQALPQAVMFWLNAADEMVLSDDRYRTSQQTATISDTRMSLSISAFERRDAGQYSCVARNNIDESRAEIRVYEVRVSERNKLGAGVVDTSDMVDASDSVNQRTSHEHDSQRENKWSHRHSQHPSSTRSGVQSGAMKSVSGHILMMVLSASMFSPAL